MKKFLILFVLGVFCIDSFAATGRVSDARNRSNTLGGTSLASKVRTNAQSAQKSQRSTATKNTVSRTTGRTGTTTKQATTSRTTVNPRVANTKTNTRTAINSKTFPERKSRAATRQHATARPGRTATTPTVATNSFGPEYTDCRDAYFSCMDQFCAMQNETYRRCVCSSKLETVKSRTRALSQTNTQLQDFKDLNISAILKTPGEVNAMLSASEGEAAMAKTKDTSQSAQQLTAISDVLAGRRSDAISSQGNSDIIKDINSIWSTTELTSGANIADLTGEALYNAVHSQCATMVSSVCPSQSTLNMVVSAYGIYIDNDCTTILNALDKQATTANAAIRETEREMTTTRLENYNAHNATSINDCIAKVRADLTSESGCGENYIHCLDLTGLYLDRNTGEPIYSENFYILNSLISLSSNVLTNTTNAKYITELNNKKRLAKASLETCRDVADSVWNEFLEQALTEIHQGQQARIRKVKDECLDVVTKCYDEQTQQLRDYSNIPEQMLLGDRLELSEEMCRVKLDTCSNLYGNGKNGMPLLLKELHNITNKKIAQNCLVTLKEYATNLCKTASTDTLHKYPYGCRMYMPGNSLYAQNPNCTYIAQPTGSRPADEFVNLITPAPFGDITNYTCWENRFYTSCIEGYYLSPQNKCLTCPDGWQCDGGTNQPYKQGDSMNSCGEDYIGSLYQKMVIYAAQYCVRPSENSNPIPSDILSDVVSVMDTIRVDMANELKTECERYDGQWATNYTYNDKAEKKHVKFYRETNADFGWGLCKIKDEDTEENEGENEGENNGSTETRI